RNGEQLGIFCEDKKYDFRLQEIRVMKEILIIKPGDEILVECNCQTLDLSGIASVSLFLYIRIFHCF
ncbi:MOXD2 protein, partial [Alopecoenas beccarii]|nr:MOXD2 protein [Alopecoenas beccarii]